MTAKRARTNSRGDKSTPRGDAGNGGGSLTIVGAFSIGKCVNLKSGDMWGLM